MVVAQLVERLLPVPEVHGSNPEAGNGPFFKGDYEIYLLGTLKVQYVGSMS